MNANDQMKLSIKIGEHAVDVAGPVHEVWKVLEVFQRLSGFDPREIERKRELDYYNQINMQQIQKQMQAYIPSKPMYTAPMVMKDIEPGAADPSWVKKLLGVGGKE